MQAIEIAKIKYIADIEFKIDNFRKSLEPYNDLIKWGSDKNSGTIVRGGMEYFFKIDSIGHISQEVKKHYNVGNTLGEFLSISDNKY